VCVAARSRRFSGLPSTAIVPAAQHNCFPAPHAFLCARPHCKALVDGVRGLTRSQPTAPRSYSRNRGRRPRPAIGAALLARKCASFVCFRLAPSHGPGESRCGIRRVRGAARRPLHLLEDVWTRCLKAFRLESDVDCCSSRAVSIPFLGPAPVVRPSFASSSLFAESSPVADHGPSTRDAHLARHDMRPEAGVRAARPAISFHNPASLGYPPLGVSARPRDGCMIGHARQLIAPASTPAPS